jgi:hypothetical protein
MEQRGMTKMFKLLGSFTAAAVVGLLLFGFSGAMNTTEVAAQSPPTPPSRFGGTVKVDGVTPSVGTVIEARVGSASCGNTAVDSDGRYTINVVAAAPANQGCGTDGAAVAFYIGGKKADQTGSWKNFDFTSLNLTYTTPPTPAPSASPSATTAPGGTNPTPRPPSTGNTADGSGSSASLLFVVFGAAVLAFGVSGVAVARRRS